MINTQRTFTCDGCQKQVDSPRDLARLKIYWDLSSWDEKTIDLCEQCVKPIKKKIGALGTSR
jgi:hypothetical protein